MLAASLEAQVLASDSSALARDCRREMKAANARLLKLGRKVCFLGLLYVSYSPLHAVRTHVCHAMMTVLQDAHLSAFLVTLLQPSDDSACSAEHR